MARATKPSAATPAQLAAIAALPDPAIITRNRWEKGGVGIIYANPRFCRLTGYSLTELAGQNTRLLHGPKTDLPLLQHGDPGHRRNGEGWLCRKDGTPFFARWNFSPWPVGSAGLLVAIYHDQSEVKRLREALLQSHMLDTVGLLASGVAHDFNNLLSVINGYCEILSGKIALVPGAQKDLDEIHRAGLKAAAIARQILEFSRRQEMEVKVVNYNTLIREITEILRRVAGDAVELELRLDSDLGNARIDPTQFQQVLLNLCFNAREAMPRGGKLTIHTYNHRVACDADRRSPGMPHGLYAVMRITDTGQGMKPVIMDKIFQPFFTTKLRGTGLGLATVRGIIRQHDGHIAVQSTPGQGTTFEVFLPETPEPEPIAPVKLASLPVTRGTETLLLIEKDEVLRKMIAGILATEGYKVTDVATADAAARTIADCDLKPQLVLINCDDRAVAALMHLLHARNPALRLISISAESPAAALPEFSPEAVMHLPKPFALSKLVLSVRTLLDAGPRAG
jgi:two-component system cell cycle sensor histidine kinase/response regulator CckA